LLRAVEEKPLLAYLGMQLHVHVDRLGAARDYQADWFWKERRVGDIFSCWAMLARAKILRVFFSSHRMVFNGGF